MDPGFIRRRAHLQIAKACGILVNSVVIVNCCIRDLVAQSVSVAAEREDSSTFRAALALSTHVNAQFSGLSGCLNSSLGPEEVKHRKAILRMVLHNIELCNKVAELLDDDMLYSIRICTERGLKRILNAAASSLAKCEEMVSDDDSALWRLAIAKKAKAGLSHHLWVYHGYASESRSALRYFEREGYVGALVHSIGALFLMYRGYAATGNAAHNVAGIIEHCLKILLSLPSTRQNFGAYKARKMYVDMCSVYEEIEQHLRPELLLNPGAEVKLRDAALRYLSEMMKIWEKEYGRYFNAVEQTGGSPSQPSTSGLGSASTGVGRAQAPYMPPQDQGIMPYSWDQPSTSGLGSTSAGVGGPQASSVPLRVLERIPIPYGAPWDQPSTSGLGSTSAGVGGPQASSVPLRVLERIPIPYGAPWDQPSTSGLGSASAGVGGSQASYMPPHYPRSTPYSYAQPSTSGLGGTGSRVRGPQASSVPLRVLERIPIPYDAPWDQPSTSGLGSTSAGVGGPQASSVPLRVLERIPIPYGAPWDQPSTSGMGGTAGTGSQQASYIPPQDPGHMPDLDVQPSTSYAQPSTSGLGGNPAGQGALQAQAPCGPLQDHSYAQPSTSGLGGNPAGQGALQAQAPCGPLQDHSYAQPSTSGLGGASSTLEEAQVSTHRSQTPDDDEDEQPSKRARYR
nr:hypothetical protein [Anaplasma phagocytophilum]